MADATDPVEVEGTIHATFTMTRDGRQVTWSQVYTGCTKWIEASGREVITLIR